MAGIQEETDSLQKTETGTWKEWLDAAEEDPVFARFGVFFFAHSNSGVVLDGVVRLYYFGCPLTCGSMGAPVGENSSSRLLASNPRDHVFWKSESDLPGDSRILRMASIREHQTPPGGCRYEGVILYTCFTT